MTDNMKYCIIFSIYYKSLSDTFTFGMGKREHLFRGVTATDDMRWFPSVEEANTELRKYIEIHKEAKLLGTTVGEFTQGFIISDRQLAQLFWNNNEALGLSYKGRRTNVFKERENNE